MMWLTNNILREILYKNNTVCCMCLKATGEHALRVYDEVNLQDPDITIEFTQIISSVFENKISETEYVSHTICDECANSAISAFKFIKKCRDINEKMSTFINNLTNCLEDTDNDNLVKAKGMYVTTDPEAFQSKVYYCQKKPVHSVSILLKRLRAFLRAEHFKRYKENFSTSPIINDCNDDIDSDQSIFESKTKIYFAELERVSCQHCGCTFRNKYTLKRHTKNTCKIIKAKLPLENENKKTERDISVQSRFEMFTCNYCNQTFQNKSVLKVHIYKLCKNAPAAELKQKNKSICSYCGKKITKYAMKRHERTHTSQFLCSKCGKVFKTEEGYENHLRMQNCNKKPLDKKPLDACTKPIEKVNCHVCNKHFASEYKLKRHVRACHNHSGVDCMLCKKKLSSKCALKLHMVVHTQEKNFECETCGGKFVSKASLLYHTRRHTGEKPYKCKHCDSRFLSASRRNMHTRIHHLPPQLKCEYCVKLFKVWGALQQHRRRHLDPHSSLYIRNADLQKSP